jgi:hypothetical protein
MEETGDEQRENGIDRKWNRPKMEQTENGTDRNGTD